MTDNPAFEDRDPDQGRPIPPAHHGEPDGSGQPGEPGPRRGGHQPTNEDGPYAADDPAPPAEADELPDAEDGQSLSPEPGEADGSETTGGETTAEEVGTPVSSEHGRAGDGETGNGETTDAGDDGGEADGGGGGAPFGLPVLVEVPELAMVLEDLVEVDRILSRVLERFIRLQDHAVSESTTGLPLERWLAAIAKRTGSDRRMLATAATACRRLPCLRGAFYNGQVSWAQVRSVALKVENLPRHLDDRVDAAISDALSGAAGTDPDGVCRVIGWHLQAIEAQHAPDPSPSGAPEADWVAMQPRLDATGGEIHGDFGAEGFALLDAALNTIPPAKGRTRTGIGADTDRAAARARGRQFARARAERLKQLCRTGTTTGGATAGTDGTGDPRDGDGDSDGGAGETGQVLSDIPGNQTLLRADLDTVLERMPGALLTRLTGGRLHVDAKTARRLMDTYGTRLRLVLVDHGRIVGVGRASRQAPGWLAEATLALHDTCSEPGCNIAARVCDLDHAQPWSDRDRPGRTDIDQLAPLCATANHDKERAGWNVTQHPDGVRIWTHRRTGLTTRTVPATRQPPPRTDNDGGPPGSDPPGSDPPEGNAPPEGDDPADGNAPTGSDPPGDGPPGSDPPGEAEPPSGSDPPGSDPLEGDDLAGRTPPQANGGTPAGPDDPPPQPRPADDDPDDIPF